jgi:hypothetical protein
MFATKCHKRVNDITQVPAAPSPKVQILSKELWLVWDYYSGLYVQIQTKNQ